MCLELALWDTPAARGGGYDHADRRPGTKAARIVHIPSAGVGIAPTRNHNRVLRSTVLAGSDTAPQA
jgi:hypothetical protein